MSKEYHGLAIKPETGRLIVLNKNAEVSSEAQDGRELRFNTKRPFDLKFPEIKESVIVQRLPVSAILPDWKINGLATGKQEEFRVALGFTSKEASPLVHTIAVWAAMKSKKVVQFEFLLGGPDLNVFFPMSKFLGLDGRSQGSKDTIVSLTQPASSLKFIKKSNVTEWRLIQEL